LFAAIIWGRK